MELNFDVREEDGLLVAVCKDPDLATNGRSVEELVQMVRELIACQFDEGDERRNAKARFNFHEESALAYE
jgi:predicted RNase H-like HicB family nuclease